MPSNAVYRNTPKGVGADGKPETPSSYEVVKLECVNRNGAVFDISPIVISMTITEELFSPIVVLNLRIRDNINFFEDFALNGQERINLSLKRLIPGSSAREIDLTFSVKEYPNYVKSAEEPNVQEYNVVAVSDFAYRSMLSRISRSVKGSPIDSIASILDRDLGVLSTSEGVCSSSFDGVITIQSPLKAIEWLRQKAFDENGAPFFVYSNITSNAVKLSSLSRLFASSNPVFSRFEYKQFFKNPAGTEDAYRENAIRVLDMNSQIKLDKLAQATGGGFASKTNVTDIAQKTFDQNVFDYSSDGIVSGNRIGVGDIISPLTSAFGFGVSKNKGLHELPDASISNVSDNTSANYQGNSSAAGAVVQNISRAKSYYANLEAISHMIQVYGDFDLNPGKKIHVSIPKATQVKDLPDGDILDESLSGEYLVAVSAHVFVGGVYTNKLKIIKDA